MNDAAQAIRALCEKYDAKPLVDTEVCLWIRDRIYETLTNTPITFRQSAIKFKGAFIEFLTDNAIFCVYLRGTDGKILDVGFPLSIYLRREYGLTAGEVHAGEITFGYSEAMDLAEQITDEICVWVGLVEDIVLT